MNLSRLLDNDTDPVWLPDGRAIAFTGRRMAEVTEIYCLHPMKEDEDEPTRDRKLKKPGKS